MAGGCSRTISGTRWAEAMAAREKGVADWFDEQGVEIQ
jgi:hypothetical protein